MPFVPPFHFIHGLTFHLFGETMQAFHSIKSINLILTVCFAYFPSLPGRVPLLHQSLSLPPHPKPLYTAVSWHVLSTLASLALIFSKYRKTGSILLHNRHFYYNTPFSHFFITPSFSSQTHIHFCILYIFHIRI